MTLNPTQRFSSRVENYIKFRPRYPVAVVDLLQSECALTPNSTIADIGSGTGILTELLLQNGNPVFGVEPNKEMREAAERMLSNYPTFRSIAATAEATTLAGHSVDLITAGQAFHWFERNETRGEFVRILKPGGWVALTWNDRNISNRPFFKAYENLLVTYGTDYDAVGAKHVDDKIVGDFFAPVSFKRAQFPNQQEFDFEGLKGRLLSSSYAPEAEHPNHAPMLESLRTIFDQYQSGGKVVFEYDTTVYYGQLAG
jgi:ubiquinone/menaquinone biosynthesis C-methylase UbiE